MRNLITICAVVLMVSSMVSAADVAGWDAFVIRNSTAGDIAPTISDDSGGGKIFQITLGGQKAGWGTNSMNGKKVGDIESLSITRDSSVTGYGPYFNIWITDGSGEYAVLANEPSNTGEWGTGTAYDTTWDILKDATAKIYEYNTAFTKPSGTTYTFDDFANYTIATPPSHWGGTGAPDDLNAGSYTAYGFNWVFGDTQSNYLDGYLVSNPTLVLYTIDVPGDYATIQEAIDAANAGDTIVITADHSEGQVVIDKDVAIQGGSVHTVTASADTGNSGDSRAWFLVNSGVELHVKDIIFDGNDHLIHQAFRHKGSGSFINCEFIDIKYNESGPDYAGLAVVAFGDGPVDVCDCTFSEIGRVGALYFGTGVSDSLFQGCTYTGKGTGDWLDYALDISAGAEVDVVDCDISACQGVASVDGSTSAGVLVTTYYGAGTAATVLRNTITANTTGIAVGYDSSDTCAVFARYNDLGGNDSEAVDNTSTTEVVDAEYNWWGDASGPSGEGPGSGDAVSTNVDYDPWLGVLPDLVVDPAGNGDYTTIQDAIDNSPGTVIFVAPGTYDEQIVIDKSLTLQGAGHTTVIQPSSESKLTSFYTLGTQTGAYWNGAKLASIISVDNVGAAGVTIKDLQVDGANVDTAPAGATYIVGISYGESAGTVDSVRVVNLDTTSETPRTYGMWFDAVSTAVSVEVDNCIITHYNKNGINARGNEITVDIHDNFVTGPGTSAIQVANGILLINGAGGTISSNIIYDDQYSGPGGWKSSGIALWEGASGILIEENTIYYLDLGIALSTNHGNATVQDNMVHDCDSGVLLESGAFNNTITGNTMENNTYGIRLNGALHPSGPPSTDPPGTGNTANNNRIVGNTSGVTSYDNTQVFDAEENWWGDADGPSGVGPGSGDPVSNYVDYDPWLTLDPGINILKLDVQTDPEYMQPGETVTIDMDALNLAQHVFGCQAILKFSSAYFLAGPTDVTVVPGGGIWDELIYDVWTVTGDLDVAVGVELTSAVGTKADGTVAKFTLTVNPLASDGTTKMIFRPYVDEDVSTYFADFLSQRVDPGSEIPSQNIIIDGTPPEVTVTSPDGGENLKGGGSHTITWTVTETYPDEDSLVIEYYDGSDWQVIATGATKVTDLSYVWTVPSLLDISNAKVRITVADLAGNTDTDDSNADFIIDSTVPSVDITSASQNPELLISLSSTTNAVKGQVDIDVAASDSLSGLDGHPIVTVDDSGANPMAVTYDGESPAGTFNYHVIVTASTDNGIATINASVSDNSGNTNSDSDTFNINKNQVSGTVEFDTLSSTAYGFNRDVVFKATDGGGVLKTWTETVSFTNNTGTKIASGPYTLTDVPAGTVNLSAKTAWNLRRRITGLDMLLDDGQETADFTGANDLLGGDIDSNGSNGINILDYSVLKTNWGTTNAVADINGDGMIQLLDYSILKSNFFKKGNVE